LTNLVTLTATIFYTPNRRKFDQSGHPDCHHFLHRSSERDCTWKSVSSFGWRGKLFPKVLRGRITATFPVPLFRRLCRKRNFPVMDFDETLDRIWKKKHMSRHLLWTCVTRSAGRRKMVTKTDRQEKPGKRWVKLSL
jgi:hypothetical protein